MPLFTKGDILQTTSQPVSQTFNFDSQTIGQCWVDLPDREAIPEIEKVASGRTFWVPGKEGELVEALCRDVLSAQQMICVSSFLIQESEFTEALLDASDRGIPVFVLTAREEDLKKPAEEMLEDERSKIKDHIDLLEKFAGRILVRTCNNFHAKYCIVDPLSPDAKGILMTCNANVDPMRGSNIEMAASLSPVEIQGFYSHFLHGFWDMANHELLSQGKFRGVRREDLDSIDRGTVTIPATWNDGLTLRDELRQLIDSATETLFLTAWAFENDEVVFPALVNAMDRGVSVKILTKPTERTTTALLPLVEKGATVCGHDRFHAKIAIADNRTAILMTANYTYKGLDEGFEAGILLKGKDTRTLSGIAALFEPVCPWKLSANALIRDVNGRVRRYVQGSGDMEVVEILSETSVELPSFQIESLNKIPDDLIPREKALKSVQETYPGKMIRQVSVTRKIIVPKIPAEAKQEEHKDLPFRIFRTKKNLYIAITQWEDLGRATKLANAMKAKVVVDSR